MPLDTESTPRSGVPPHAVDELRRQLEECRAERERLIAELAPVAAPNVDPVAYVQSQAARATIAEIDAALGRILDGTYGVCRRCGKPIPEERLAVRPYTDSCVGCQGGAAAR